MGFCSLGFSVEVGTTCKGPPELERAISTQPSASAYDALGVYFGQRNSPHVHSLHVHRRFVLHRIRGNHTITSGWLCLKAVNPSVRRVSFVLLQD